MRRPSSFRSSSTARRAGFPTRAGASSSRSAAGRSPPTRSWSRPGLSRHRSCPSSPRTSTRASGKSTALVTGSQATCPEGAVLVVGGGNGLQIAKELSATHKVLLSVGSKQKPLPQRIAGRDLFWWLTKTRLLSTTVESRLGSKLRHRDTLIGSSPRELKRRYGVELKPRAMRRAAPCASRTERARGGRCHLGDGLPPRRLLDRPSHP